MPGVIVVMVLVIVGFLALALTDSASLRADRPAVRLAAAILWLVIVVSGWAAVVYVIATAPGGAITAWPWVQGQSTLIRAAMWLFLLPWMIAVWAWQSSLALWLRSILVIGLAVFTVGLAAAQLFPKRSAR